MRRSWLAAVLGLVWLAGSPLFAYTIYLRDGKRIEAKEKYRVEGDRALITLPSGTQTFLRVSEIDIARTEQANNTDYGKAVVIEGSEKQPLTAQAPEQDNGSRLGELIQQRGTTAPRIGPGAKRQAVATGAPGAPARTAAGFPDLYNYSRNPFTFADVSKDLERMLSRSGFSGVAVYQGTRSNRPLVEFQARTEAEVFDGLQACASALVDLKSRYDQKVGGLEIVMLTQSKAHAGQFELTLDKAEQLVAHQIRPEEFYLAFLEF
ncbi:MAG: hypothetical protein U0002_09025 [Thermoanaerobaculia bacterium]